MDCKIACVLPEIQQEKRKMKAWQKFVWSHREVILDIDVKNSLHILHFPPVAIFMEHLLQ